MSPFDPSSCNSRHLARVEQLIKLHSLLGRLHTRMPECKSCLSCAGFDGNRSIENAKLRIKERPIHALSPALLSLRSRHLCVGSTPPTAGHVSDDSTIRDESRLIYHPFPSPRLSIRRFVHFHRRLPSKANCLMSPLALAFKYTSLSLSSPPRFHSARVHHAAHASDL